MSKKSFGNAIDLDDEIDNVEISSTSLADQALATKNSENYNKFKEGNLRKEINKMFTLKLTQYQFDIIEASAKHHGKTMKDFVLNYVAEEAKKLGLFEKIKPNN